MKEFILTLGILMLLTLVSFAQNTGSSKQETDVKQSISKSEGLVFQNSQLVKPDKFIPSSNSDFFALTEDVGEGIAYDIYRNRNPSLIASGIFSIPFSDGCFDFNVVGVSDQGTQLLLAIDCKVFDLAGNGPNYAIYYLENDSLLTNIEIDWAESGGDGHYYKIKGFPEFSEGNYTQNYASKYYAVYDEKITVREIDSDEIIWESPKQKKLYYAYGTEVNLDGDIVIIGTKGKSDENEQIIWYDVITKDTVYTTQNPFGVFSFYSYLDQHKLIMPYVGYPYQRIDTEVILDLSTGSFKERKIESLKELNKYLKENSRIIKEGMKSEGHQFKDAHATLWNIFMDNWDGTSKKNDLKGQIDAAFYPKAYWDTESDTSAVADDWYVFSSYGNKLVYRDLVRNYSLFGGANQHRQEIKLMFWNGNRENPLHRKVTMVYHMEKGPIFYTEDNFYMSFENLEGILGFESNDTSLTFEQLDLKYNRPDIILDRLGHADSELIKAYYDAYKNRLLKMGVTEAMIKDDYSLKDVVIDNFEYLNKIILDN